MVNFFVHILHGHYNFQKTYLPLHGFYENLKADFWVLSKPDHLTISIFMHIIKPLAMGCTGRHLCLTLPHTTLISVKPMASAVTYHVKPCDYILNVGTWHLTKHKLSLQSKGIFHLEK
jgi:hypothetical protein